MRLDWIFLPRKNPCAKFYIIIILILIIIIIIKIIIIINNNNNNTNNKKTENDFSFCSFFNQFDPHVEDTCTSDSERKNSEFLVDFLQVLP